MTLTISLPSEIDAELRKRASAEGRDAAEYAADVLARALRDGGDADLDADQAERQQMSRTIEQFLKNVESLEPDPNRPRLRGQEAEIQRIIVDKLQNERHRP